MRMKKNLKKICQISVILLLLVLVLNPVVTSRIIKKDNEDPLDGKNIKVYSLRQNDFIKIRDLLDKIIDLLMSGIGIQGLIQFLDNLGNNDNSIINNIIDFIRDRIADNNNNRSPLQKTFIVSQGWSYNLNLYKKSVFQLKRNFITFWHYCKSARTGGESKTFILKPEDMLISKSAEALIGRQTGLMIRPKGIYIYKASMFPKPSYTFFIGFANNVISTGQEKYEINLPIN